MGLPNITTSDPSELLTIIISERKIELVAEGGHRWLDLKRYDLANEELQPIKEQWQQTDEFWPAPEIEIFNNSNLLPQNDGY